MPNAPRRPYSATRQAYAVDLYEDGASIGKIAGAMGLAKSTVYRWVVAADVVRRVPGNIKRPPKPVPVVGAPVTLDATQLGAQTARAALSHFIPLGNGGPFWGGYR